MNKANLNPDKHSEFEEFVARRREMTEEEQHFEAGQIIERLDQIDSSKAFENIKQQIEPKSISINWIQNFRKYAAILIIPMALALAYSVYLNLKPAPQETVAYELTSPAGVRTEATLPDGTQIWLNAQSTIKYQLPFVQKERNIELTGEAFFEVTKNPKSPFVVKSQNASIRVLGTKFNVKAYPEEKEIAVALEEGSVDFSATGHQNKNEHTILKPSDYLVFRKASSEVSVLSGDLKKFVSWRYNRMILDETPMRDVASLLERWYGIQVEIVDKELLSYKFSTTFENESLSRVLELLEISSPVKVKYINNEKANGTDNSLHAKVYFYKK